MPHLPPNSQPEKVHTDESALLRHIYARSADITRRFPYVLIGPGDDCAAVDHGMSGALRSPTNATQQPPLLLTVDQLIEHRHFNPETPPELIARKAIARSISDIAAMGGTPTWSLATAMLPPPPHPSYTQNRADAIFDSMAAYAAGFKAPLIGGDIAQGPPGAPLVLTTTVGGIPHAQRGPVLRSTARPGDDVWITGRIGDSFASGRHLSFEPRIGEARVLCDLLGANLHAMIDVSDGVGIDAGRIATASGVSIELDLAAIPLHLGVLDPLRAIADGEDYELLVTIAADARSVASRVPYLTRIGCVADQPAGSARGPACTIRTADGRTLDASAMGWDHGRS